jgi:hypothetical protein
MEKREKFEKMSVETAVVKYYSITCPYPEPDEFSLYHSTLFH